MRSVLQVELVSPQVEVVDLSSLEPLDLEPLWDREKDLWHRVLYWDVSPGIALLRRAMERNNLAGKGARVGGAVVGYGYSLREGHRAILGSCVVGHEADGTAAGAAVLASLLASLKADSSVLRIESHFVSFDMAWLRDIFLGDGFREHPREFLRRSLDEPPPPGAVPSSFTVEPCGPSCLSEAAALLQRAHAGRTDAEMSELYRSRDGCRTLLENIVQRRGCGEPIPFASLLARDRARTLKGIAIVTEISDRHAHLAQLAVGPEVEGQGLGRLLLTLVLDALSREGFRTVSLMVSRSNHRALSLYGSLGFKNVLRFPVFSWDRDRGGPRFR